MSELLTAASVLLGIIGVLNAIWYDDIKSGLSKKMPPHKEDRAGIISDLKSILWARAFPLSLASTCIGLVFLPPSIQIILQSGKAYIDFGICNILNYDPIATSLVLVQIFMCALATQSVVSAFKLYLKIKSGER